jgi:hypothetical protein
LEGLGQVDLERRIHRNQDLEGLSRMSFVIIQAVVKRLEQKRKTRLFAELGSTMKLPRSGSGKLSLEVIELADHERPPMITIPEYLARRSGASASPSDGATGAATPGGAETSAVAQLGDVARDGETAPDDATPAEVRGR